MRFHTCEQDDVLQWCFHNKAQGDCNVQQSANGKNITQKIDSEAMINKFLGLLEKKDEQIAKSQEQIDRLIGLLESK